MMNFRPLNPDSPKGSKIQRESTRELGGRPEVGCAVCGASGIEWIGDTGVLCWCRYGLRAVVVAYPCGPPKTPITLHPDFYEPNTEGLASPADNATPKL